MIPLRKLVLFLSCLCWGVVAPGSKALAADPQTNNPVLMIIDVQKFYFPGGRLPLSSPEAATANVERLLKRFRERGWPVIHVQHLKQDQTTPSPNSGDVQYQIQESVQPLPGEIVIGKHHANAFRDTTLLETLRGLRVGPLVVTGMQTHMCVEAAARAAADYGFNVVVVSDACATRPLKFQDTEVPAAEVHAATLASLQGNYARVLSTDAFLKETQAATAP